MIKKIIVCILIFCDFAVRGQVKKPVLQSGFYDDIFPMYIGYDSVQQLVTGYIIMHSDEPKDKFVCELYFTGQVTGNSKIRIKFHKYVQNDDEISNGWLTIRSVRKVTIQSEKFLLPCQNLIDIQHGEDNEFTRKTIFRRIAIIKPDKQYLYREPNQNTKTNSYLVQNDPVGIVSEENEWFWVVYLKNEKIHTWIPKIAVR